MEHLIFIDNFFPVEQKNKNPKINAIMSLENEILPSQLYCYLYAKYGSRHWFLLIILISNSVASKLLYKNIIWGICVLEDDTIMHRRSHIFLLTHFELIVHVVRTIISVAILAFNIQVLF